MITPTDKKIIYEYVYGSLCGTARACLEHRMTQEKPLRLYCLQLRQNQLNDAQQSWRRMQDEWKTKTS